MANERQSQQQRSERAQTGAPSAQQGEWQPSGQRQGGQMGGGPAGDAPARAGRGYPAARTGTELGYYGNPFAMMRRLGDEMDRLFESFGIGRAFPPSLFGTRFGAESGYGEGVASPWSPSVDVSERDNTFHVSVDLPGLRKEDVSVQIENDAIVIQGQRNDERTTTEQGYYQRERSYGRFYRAIPLPEGVDAEAATATFDNGVLRVEMPTTQRAARGRKLEIRDAEAGGRRT